MKREFPLHEKACKVVDFNPRKEKHGKELVLAGDLKLTMSDSNDVLSMFDSQLRDSFYWKNPGGSKAAAADQGQLDVTVEVSDKPNLRVPLLKGPFDFQWELAGYVLTIPYGIGKKTEIVIPDVKLNSFQIEPQDGGSVIITFKAQFSRISDSVSGRLSDMIQTEVRVSLEPPDAGQSDIEDKAPTRPPKKKSAAAGGKGLH